MTRYYESIRIVCDADTSRWISVSASNINDLSETKIDVSPAIRNGIHFSGANEDSLYAIVGSAARYAYRKMGRPFRPIRLESVGGTENVLESQELPVAISLVVQKLAGVPIDSSVLDGWTVTTQSDPAV